MLFRLTRLRTTNLRRHESADRRNCFRARSLPTDGRTDGRGTLTILSTPCGKVKQPSAPQWKSEGDTDKKLFQEQAGRHRAFALPLPDQRGGEWPSLDDEEVV